MDQCQKQEAQQQQASELDAEMLEARIALLAARENDSLLQVG
jgi:hypothetical protein